jgi:FemAB-related protein (PEP-CTERM system-associated)
MNSVCDSRLLARTYDLYDLTRCQPRLEAFVARAGQVPLSRHPSWLAVLARGLDHTPHCLVLEEGHEVRGLLPLVHVQSALFGRFLVSLPYLNYGGPVAEDDDAARLLVDRAVGLADELGVRHLELRNSVAVDHPALTMRPGHKVQMQLELPATAERLWLGLDSSVRSQVRKGWKNGLRAVWGGEDLLDEFYGVFSRNMRDLGTPVFGRALFHAVVRQFPGRAEFCVIRSRSRPLAAALLLHGWGITEVPSASSLKAYNRSCANMLLYWNLLERATDRGQSALDFGRSTPDSPTFKFKKQWGAVPHPAPWQYYVRRGAVSDVRPDNPKFRLLIHAWRRLPVPLTRLIGPPIVRGIP